MRYISVIWCNTFLLHPAIICVLRFCEIIFIKFFFHCSLFVFFKLQCNLFCSLCNTLSFYLQYIYVVLCELFLLLIVVYLSMLSFFIAYITVLPCSAVVVFSAILFCSSVYNIYILYCTYICSVGQCLLLVWVWYVLCLIYP